MRESANAMGLKGFAAAWRDGSNLPVRLCQAQWDGYRNVRVEVQGRVIGLATTTYSYNLDHDERVAAARRIAALWNLAALNNWETADIERALIAQGNRKDGASPQNTGEQQ